MHYQTETNQIEALRQSFGTDLCILGHHYQTDAVIRHCDHTGDSLELARKISSINARHIVFCGVSFMGETAALLTSEGQNVYLPNPNAHCMMALMASGCHVGNVFRDLKDAGLDVLPLAYVNTSLGLKAQVGAHNGAVCTSANAEKMLAWALEKSDKVLFLPDKHLARNTAKKLGLTEKDWTILRLSGDGLAMDLAEIQEKRLLIWPGSCPLHGMITEGMVQQVRKNYPGCRILVHPECPPEVVDACDGAGSTSFLIREAEKAAQEKAGLPLIIGTEANLVGRLAKRFSSTLPIHPLFNALCPDMNAISEHSLLTILLALKEGKATALSLPEKECPPARASLERMLSAMAKD